MVKYTDDLVAWAEETAQAVLDGRFEEVDIEHLAEELRDVGSEQEHALESRLMQIMLHMLKKRYQPEKWTRSWDLSIREQRIRIERLLVRNPSLRPRVEEFLQPAYDLARVRAARQTGLDLDLFPEACVFTPMDVLEG